MPSLIAAAAMPPSMSTACSSSSSRGSAWTSLPLMSCHCGRMESFSICCHASLGELCQAKHMFATDCFILFAASVDATVPRRCKTSSNCKGAVARMRFRRPALRTSTVQFGGYMADAAGVTVGNGGSGFSVFWLPLSHAIGITTAVACPADMSFFGRMFATTCDWKISELGWMFTLFFVFLGLAAAIWGGWLERAGPRKAGFVAALCWCGGLVFSAWGIYVHQIWMLWLGSGIIGGVGLGLGYISPVSTLIKWFPDRRGMATG